MQKSLQLKVAAEKSEQEVVMDYYSSQINKLIQELSELPGIGAKSAQRLAFHILNMPVEQVEGLSEAIINARKNVRYCKECFTLTDDELCPICKDASRNHKTIMVVENTRDLAAYEKTQKYDGVYHVLHGAISPMLGIGPNDIKLKELMQRLQQDVLPAAASFPVFSSAAGAGAALSSSVESLACFSTLATS